MYVSPWVRPALRVAGRVLGTRHTLKAIVALRVAWSGLPCTGDPAATAQFLAHTGDRDRAMHCLAWMHERDISAGYLLAHPVWAPYHSDPDFIALLVDKGLVTPSEPPPVEGG